MRQLSALVLLAFLLSLAAAAEEPPGAADPDSGDPPRSRRSAALAHLRDDARYLLTFPQRKTRKGVVATSTVLAGIGVLILLDDEIRAEVQEHRNDTLDRWESRIEPFGHGRVTVLAATAIYAAGALSDREPLTETGRTLIEALFFTELFTKAGKGLFGRDDPGEGNRASEFFSGGTVFPSGHTSRAFAIAAVLSERYGRRVAWVAYPLAGLVGLFRIESDSHWASDVLAGAALGYWTGKAIARRRAERRGDEGPRVTVLPALSPARREVAVVLRVTF